MIPGGVSMKLVVALLLAGVFGFPVAAVPFEARLMTSDIGGVTTRPK